jgi:hypothetical protein
MSFFTAQNNWDKALVDIQAKVLSAEPYQASKTLIAGAVPYFCTLVIFCHSAHGTYTSFTFRCARLCTPCLHLRIGRRISNGLGCRKTDRSLSCHGAVSDIKMCLVVYWSALSSETTLANAVKRDQIECQWCHGPMVVVCVRLHMSQQLGSHHSIDSAIVFMSYHK